MIGNLLPSFFSKRIGRLGVLRRLGVPIVSALKVASGVGEYNRFLDSRLNLLPNQFARKVGVVVDVGANIGDWSEMAIRILAPDKLIAIEPNPIVYKKLMARIGMHKASLCINMGVGKASELLPFNITKGSQFASFLELNDGMDKIYGDSFAKERVIEAKVDKLDALLEVYQVIDLLKIDVQGYERFVLEGANDVLKRTKHILIEANFEHHYKSDIHFCELDKLLGSFGFVLSNFSEPFIGGGRVLWMDAVYSNVVLTGE